MRYTLEPRDVERADSLRRESARIARAATLARIEREARTRAGVRFLAVLGATALGVLLWGAALALFN